MTNSIPYTALACAIALGIGIGGVLTLRPWPSMLWSWLRLLVLYGLVNIPAKHVLA